MTERFALKTKYFYDEENLESFREEYDAMALHEKAMENIPLAAGSVVALGILLVGVLTATGVL